MAAHDSDVPEIPPTEQVEKQAAERVEARLQDVESLQNRRDVTFQDEKGRPIALRTWETGRLAQVRAYDLTQGSVPENPNIGQAGYANAMVETGPQGDRTVRLNDIGTSPDYRHAGIGNKMLDQVEDFARRNRATEIRGTIDSDSAKAFWEHQADRGYQIVSSSSYYGDIVKKL